MTRTMVNCRPAFGGFSAGKEITGRHHAGDRVTVHGVTLFGQSLYSVEHIPTTERSHNERLVMSHRRPSRPWPWPAPSNAAVIDRSLNSEWCVEVTLLPAQAAAAAVHAEIVVASPLCAG